MSQGDRLGPYEVRREVGRGGMGVVYLAYDAGLDRLVAIKQIAAGVLGGGAKEGGGANGGGGRESLGMRRFLREAQATARLAHPHIVTIHAILQPPVTATPCIVMEYLAGGSLAGHVRAHGPLPWRVAAGVIRDAAAGLACAHAAGIVHRDLKPGNLMWAGEAGSAVKLVDFGLAHAPMIDPELSVPGAFVGSPSYVSPEQAMPGLYGAGGVTGKSDLYSLGCTFFALLAGRPPFVHEEVGSILHDHVHTALPDVRAFAPGPVPDGVVRLLGQLTAKDPGERPASARGVHEVLCRVLAMGDGEHDFSGGAAVRAVKAAAEEGEKSARKAGRKAGRSRVKAAAVAVGDVAELSRGLAEAEKSGDVAAQIESHRSLYFALAAAKRSEEASRHYRAALALHLKWRGRG